MNGRGDDREVLELLESLRRAAADDRPSPAVEQRVLAEFCRLHGRAAPEPTHARSRTAWPRRGRSAWLAAAASVALVAAGAAGWHAATSGRARTGEASAAAPLEARSLNAVMPAVLPVAGAAHPVVVSAEAAVPVGRQATGTGRRSLGAARPAHVEFVAWPGADALPHLESGQLIRAELPASVVPMLGLAREVGARRPTVMADVIVGQDGWPRAVRLVGDDR